MSDDIGDRFKAYERCFDYALPRRLPLVIRVDGRAFHGLKLTKPFDSIFGATMGLTAIALCKEVQGAALAYLQSDEISIVARDDMTNTTEPWVGKRLSKILSLSAAIATSAFNINAPHERGERQFDARAFVLPDLNEVTNYLIWRQQDATRNSVSMAAQALFSHKMLHKKNTNDMLDMLRVAGSPWEDIPIHFKRGMVCRKITNLRPIPQTGETCERREWVIDYNAPVFTQDRAYVEAIYTAPTGEQEAAA